MMLTHTRKAPHRQCQDRTLIKQILKTSVHHSMVRCVAEIIPQRLKHVLKRPDNIEKQTSANNDDNA